MHTVGVVASHELNHAIFVARQKTSFLLDDRKVLNVGLRVVFCYNGNLYEREDKPGSEIHPVCLQCMKSSVTFHQVTIERQNWISFN